MAKDLEQAQLELATYTPSKDDADFKLPVKRFTEAEERRGEHGIVTRIRRIVINFTCASRRSHASFLSLTSTVLRKIDICLLPVLAFTYGLQFLESAGILCNS